MGAGAAVQIGDDVAFAGAARQAEMVRAGEVSPTELVRLSLDRIGRLDPKLNSFRKVFAEKALLEAEQAEARLRAGEERPLLGVPIAIKDEVDVVGEVKTKGTDGFTEPAAADCEMVRRLREAGAIVVGLTLLPEMAICGFTESATYGVTRNPWNPQHTPGGSSGGSGAAVAAGLVPIASAGDGAGSIRIPAASCGLFGLKPSRGRVSLAPYLEGWRGLAVEGCLSRNVLDTALWLDVVSGGSQEPEAPPPPERRFVEAVKQSPGKLRVAHSTLAPRAVAPPILTEEAKGAVADAVELLGGLGHEVVQRDPDWGGIGNNITARFLGGVAETVEEVPHPERLERRTRGFGRLGGLFPKGLYERAMGAGRAADAARVNAIFDSHDVLVMPVMAGTALPVRRWEGRGALRTVLGMSRFYPYCVPWNHLGNPAMSVPLGFAPDGMPLAVQIVGRPGAEATLLSLAAQLEAERPWADKRPPIS
ncbi:MAG TPA: amidase [Solirubrobacterales bacterium]|nr:amidase [Solirubrobacterales bacterium]